MNSECKAKKFGDRMSHRGSGKAMGERGVMRGTHGKSAGEAKMGNMTRPLTAPMSSVKQSKDGNGGKK